MTQLFFCTSLVSFCSVLNFQKLQQVDKSSNVISARCLSQYCIKQEVSYNNRHLSGHLFTTTSTVTMETLCCRIHCILVYSQFWMPLLMKQLKSCKRKVERILQRTKVTFGAMDSAFLNNKARTDLCWSTVIVVLSIIEIHRYVSTFCSFYFCQICTAEPLKLLILGRKSQQPVGMGHQGWIYMLQRGHKGKDIRKLGSSLWCARLKDWRHDASTSNCVAW